MVVMFFMEWSIGFCVDYERKKQCVIQHKILFMNGQKKKNIPKTIENQGSGIIPVYPSCGIARKTWNKTYGATKSLQGVGLYA
ncbi:hypothetical protein AA15237_3005 [Komagataeibacter xylinus NBRC 15237]|nr:hypothetical protein AA15237_3005 [Komagataeibacter xylinus NBRC 15237]